MKTIRLLVLAAAAAFGVGSTQAADSPEITVYKSPTCGCCKVWAQHLEQNGFRVRTQNVEDVNEYKIRYGVRPQYASCHTAVVNGYFIEGHVPAGDIKRLLAERPKLKGLAVPGMPMGSPGMEGPYKQPYDVMALDHEGRARVYARH